MVEDGRLQPPATIDVHPDGPNAGDASKHTGQYSLPPVLTSLQPQKSVPDAADPTKQWSLNIFRQVEERLAEYAGYDFDRFPLVFLKLPAQKDSVSDDALILDESSPLNTVALDHEKWLQHHCLLFQTLTHKYRDDRRMSLQIAKIKKKLEKQLELLMRKKALEWKHQCAAISKAGDCLVDSRKPSTPLAIPQLCDF